VRGLEEPPAHGLKHGRQREEWGRLAPPTAQVKRAAGSGVVVPGRPGNPVGGAIAPTLAHRGGPPGAGLGSSGAMSPMSAPS
jgi:hypothetical protein